MKFDKKIKLVFSNDRQLIKKNNVFNFNKNLKINHLQINRVNNIKSEKPNKSNKSLPLGNMINRIQEFRNSCGGCGKKTVVIK